MPDIGNPLPTLTLDICLAPLECVCVVLTGSVKGKGLIIQLKGTE